MGNMQSEEQIIGISCQGGDHSWSLIQGTALQTMDTDVFHVINPHPFVCTTPHAQLSTSVDHGAIFNLQILPDL